MLSKATPMKHSAFSLLELAIILAVLAAGMKLTLMGTQSSLDKQQLTSTTQDLSKIEKSLNAYMKMHGKLPRADMDGDGIGDATAGLGGLPYIDLQLSKYDRYGQTYMYDAADALLDTNTSNIDAALATLDNATDFPQVADENNVSQYVVCAVVISLGKNKTLDEKNASGERIYTSESVPHAKNSIDDTMIEIRVEE